MPSPLPRRRPSERRMFAVGRYRPGYVAQLVDTLEAAAELLERIAGRAGWLVAGSYTESARIDAVTRRARDLIASHRRAR